jgi:hypothetical protein
MSLLEKFGAEQGGQHPGPLTWPGSGLGLPILGRVAPNVRQDEFENIDHKATYHAREFRSWVAEDMALYNYVQERANNVGEAGVTWFAIRQYERIRDPGQRGWLLWLEWVQVYGVLPRELMAGGGQGVHRAEPDGGVPGGRGGRGVPGRRGLAAGRAGGGPAAPPRPGGVARALPLRRRRLLRPVLPEEVTRWPTWARY